jgi:hypothetical protein
MVVAQIAKGGPQLMLKAAVCDGGTLDALTSVSCC